MQRHRHHQHRLTAPALAAALAAAGCVLPEDEAALDDTAEAAAAAPLAATTGLVGEYFRSAAPDPQQRVLARIDGAIDFTWGFGAPDPAMPADGWSARWSGTLAPRYSELYALTVAADDRARVWIDGALVIDHRSAGAPTTGYAVLSAARRHAITVEYEEAWGWAAVRLSWQSASQPAEAIGAARFAPVPQPPAQPLTGPGGRGYPHAACTQTHRPMWNDDHSYWVFEPASPAPASANVVVFNHGWMGNTPSHYAGWLDHLCRKGSIVIFPRYQSLLTAPGFFTPNAVISVQDALSWLGGTGRVRPRVADGMVVMGHSAGGTVSANMVDGWQASGLPAPRALFAVQPATHDAVPYTSLSQIPASTRVACWVGDEDTVVGRVGCDAIFTRTGHVPGRRYLWQRSDRRGAPWLVADHFQPSELTPYTDALDYLGTWRTADAMIDCAWRGTSCGVGAGPLLGQGAWSDGASVTPALVSIDAVPACPAGSTAKGC